MKKEGIFEVGDRFILPGNSDLGNEIFIVVGIRKLKDNIILEAICRGSEMLISVNMRDVEFLGKEFHTG